MRSSFYWLENVAVIKRNTMPFQEFDVFLLKRFSAMMCFLVANVLGHTIQM